MYFNLKILLSDNDYLDYNCFWNFKSPYGRKQMIKFRISFFVIFAVMIAIFLFGNGISRQTIISVIPCIILLVIFQALLKPFTKTLIKTNFKALKKNGKTPYTESSVIDFYDEHLIESASQSTIEHKYSAIERVSIVPDKVIYIHVNSLMAYIIPVSCFESMAQYENFIAFIKTKCNNVDVY